MYPANDKRQLSGKILTRRTDRAFCVVCGKPVDLLDFQASAGVFKTDFLAKQVEIHRIHNQWGEVMICAPSLFASFEQRPVQQPDAHCTRRIEKKFEKDGQL